ncbi:hypothetical protein [Methanimicrococcus hongohii]|nr:hypothetical protein [Methanimicrococcus sp. Hf6]
MITVPARRNSLQLFLCCCCESGLRCCRSGFCFCLHLLILW